MPCQTVSGSGNDVIYGFTVTQQSDFSASISDSGGYAGLGLAPLGQCSASIACEPPDGSYNIAATLAPGSYGLIVKAYPSYSGSFSLTASLTTATAPALNTQVSGAMNSYRYFSVVVPSGRPQLVISISGTSTEDADLYISRTVSMPTSSAGNHTWNAATGSVPDTVTIPNPVAGTYYIGVFGYTAYNNWTLTATY
ncbi:MAG: hypothetical protein DI536_15850 [Archangium gephyra]|uniref:Peptidase C-terminal archaeal/bacterial domain-containing protein n=1 Tax=Archangium gephyra TaxID=48 RepID=A0A2W5VN44_9BACT|nr:MAG: hypothetical protein DI536_15850 [Archangium gephyra]